ncbi:hypothetical protein EDB19DRAFT_1916550 [Suillus lakei]|nr:hypothetical protein EDB19DRAFT_1916550 [Suillus lakei]
MAIPPWMVTSIPPSTSERVPSVRDCIPSRISQEDKDTLDVKLAQYTNKLGLTTPEPKTGKPITYLPLWMEDNVAHGHYDGYCKQSQSFLRYLPDWSFAISGAPLLDPRPSVLLTYFSLPFPRLAHTLFSFLHFHSIPRPLFWSSFLFS